jgi:hypothetical protein
MVNSGMKRRYSEPRTGLRLQIEIYQRRKAEGEIGARKLRAIGREKLRMETEHRVVERTLAADMHMRIDETRDEEAATPVDPPCMRAHDKTGRVSPRG